MLYVNKDKRKKLAKATKEQGETITKYGKSAGKEALNFGLHTAKMGGKYVGAVGSIVGSPGVLAYHTYKEGSLKKGAIETYNTIDNIQDAFMREVGSTIKSGARLGVKSVAAAGTIVGGPAVIGAKALKKSKKAPLLKSSDDDSAPLLDC